MRRRRTREIRALPLRAACFCGIFFGAGCGANSAPELPSAPASFEIELSGSRCLGDCPVYSVSVNDRGSVTFYGALCVARPGPYHKTVPAKDARAIYDRLRRTPFARMREHYFGKADGCTSTDAGDAPTSSWRVEADDTTKTVERYYGCEGVPTLEQLDALEPIVQELTGIVDWLEPRTPTCGGAPTFEVKEWTFVLGSGGSAVGTLVVHTNYEFELLDCAGEMVQSGVVLTESLIRNAAGRLIFLGADRSPLELPEGLGVVGSVVIDFPLTGTSQQLLAARGLREDDELTLDVTVAGSCADL